MAEEVSPNDSGMLEAGSVNFDNLPAEILESSRAVLWKRKQRNGHETKVPYQPGSPDNLSAVNDPATWGTFGQARSAYEDGKADGVGIVLGNGLCGMDLDDCLDPETGALTAEARAIIREVNSYTEISPSCKGIHIVVHGTLPPGRRRTGKIEMYSEGRYFTVTGRHLEGTPTTIETRTPQLAALHERLFGRNGTGRQTPQTPPPTPNDDDAALLDRARRAANGETFARLWGGDASGYPSASEADLALCSLLAFWVGKDASRMDGLFRQSGLMRAKWDARRGDRAYGERTIAKVIADGQQTYRGDGAWTGREDTLITIEHLSDLGNSKRFIAQHGHDLRYVRPLRKWLYWAGTRWRWDEIGEVVRMAKETSISIYAEAAAQTDEPTRKALAAHALRCEAEAKIKAMISLAESEVGVAVTPDQFDRDPWLFNCLNGTIDLRTAAVREHRREDMITKLAPVIFDPQAACPIFERFVDRIFGGDEHLIRFLQKAVGYCLTGDTSEQCLFVFYGIGSNGKTTLFRTVSDLLSEYAIWTPTETLLLKRGQSIPNDVARLRGARFVGAVEAEGGRRLAEALIKQLTGGDRIAARFLYGEYFDFIPSFKLWLAVNHKPIIKETTHAIWRRIRLIPCAVIIPEGEQDKTLTDKLRAESSGILRWAVEGCRLWQLEGLTPPSAVKAATQDYRGEMDSLGDFLAIHTISDSSAMSTAGELYATYRGWAQASGEAPESQKFFGTMLGHRGLVSRTRGGVRYWLGLRIRAIAGSGT